MTSTAMIDERPRATYEFVENADVPLDPRRRKYPFKRLRVGDGFDVPDDRGVNPKGESRRLLSLKKSALAFCKANNDQALEFVVGDAPGKPGFIRCVRTY